MIDTQIGRIQQPIDRLVAFVTERQQIYELRQLEQPKPWTFDPVLQMYRFSNMLREEDTVTKWIAENWRDCRTGDPDLWFAMVVARLVNEPETLKLMQYPTGRTLWNRESFKQAILARQKKKLRAYNPAYMIAACKVAVPKVELNLRVLDSLWDSRVMLRPKAGDTLRSYHTVLGQFWGLGSFLSAQVVADLKYASGSPLAEAADWMTFAASGPGSRRGLVRVHGLSTDMWRKWKEDDWWLKLGQMRDVVLPQLKHPELRTAHAQDSQNWLCEFDKYERARLEQGKPKQRYKGEA